MPIIFLIEVLQMIAFLKKYDFEIVKKKLILLYLLNISDIIFTLILLNTGFYMEVNFLMKTAVQNPLASFALKAILPGILIIYLFIRMQKATDKQLKQSNFIINCAIIIYLLINISHLLWVALLLFYI